MRHLLPLGRLEAIWGLRSCNAIGVLAPLAQEVDLLGTGSVSSRAQIRQPKLQYKARAFLEWVCPIRGSLF